MRVVHQLLTVIVFGILALSTSAQDPPKKPEDTEKVLARLLERVKQKDNLQARADAIFELAEFGPKAAPALPDLLDALQTKHEEVRLNAAITLAKIGKPAVKPVAALLQSKDAPTRFYAIWTLGAIGPDAQETTPAIILAMTDKNEDIRRKAAFALGQLAGDPDKTIAVLVGAFQDENDDVREAAGTALAKFGKRAVPPLIGLLKDKNPKAQQQASTSLGAIGADAKDAVPILKELFLSPKTDIAAHYAEILAQIGKASLPALEAGFIDPREEIRFAAGEAMAKVGADAVPFLVDALGSKKVEIRRLAAETLWPMQIGDKMVVTALGFALADEDDTVRNYAINALANLGVQAKPAAAKLKAALLDRTANVAVQAFHILQACNEDVGPTFKNALASKDIKLRITAAALMMSVGFSTNLAEPVLVETLKNEDMSLKMQAALALAPHQLQVNKLLPLFRDGLKNNAANVRRQSAEGLGLMRDKATAAAPALADAMADRDESVAQSAYNASTQVRGDPDAIVPILAKVYKERPGARINVVNVASLYGIKAKEIFREGLKDRDKEVRQQTLYALRHVDGDLKDLVPLLLALAKDKATQDRGVITYLFQRMGVAGAPHLGEMLHDSDLSIRLRACHVLNQMGLVGQKVLEGHIAPLMEIYKSPDENVRIQAVDVMSNLGDKAGKVRPVLKEAAAKDSSPAVRSLAAQHLGRLGGEAPFLAKQFHIEKDGDVRMHLVAGVIRSENQKLALPLMKLALKDDSVLVRTTVAGSVGTFGQDNAECFALFQFAMKDVDGEVRGAAAFHGAVFGEKTWPLVEAALKTGKRDTDRYGLLFCLHTTQYRSKTLIPKLIECLSDAEPQVAQYACGVLEHIGPDAAAALPKLRELAKSAADGNVQNSAQVAIKSIEAPKK